MSKIQLMSLRHSAFYTPYLMTMAGGFLKEQGLEYEYQPETAQRTVANSFLDGSCDVAQSAVATSFAALEKSLISFHNYHERSQSLIANSLVGCILPKSTTGMDFLLLLVNQI